jgi:hypothetical protein
MSWTMEKPNTMVSQTPNNPDKTLGIFIESKTFT